MASYSCIEEAISRDLYENSLPIAGDDWVVYAGHAIVNVMNKSDTNMVPVNRIIPYSNVGFIYINSTIVISIHMYLINFHVSFFQVKYSQVLYNGDLVIVELKQLLEFNQTVGAICLAKQSIEPRQLCAIAGWGVHQANCKKIIYIHALNY